MLLSLELLGLVIFASMATAGSSMTSRTLLEHTGRCMHTILAIQRGGFHEGCVRLMAFGKSFDGMAKLGGPNPNTTA